MSLKYNVDTLLTKYIVFSLCLPPGKVKEYPMPVYTCVSVGHVCVYVFGGGGGWRGEEG